MLKENTVVYVGQSKIGVSRPFLHRDKNFDRVEIMSVPKEKLDEFESYYIKKYAPIYNQKLINAFDIGIISAKLKIQERYGRKDFSMIYLRKAISSLQIKPYEFKGLTYSSRDNLDLVFDFIDLKVNGLKSENWKHDFNVALKEII